MGQNGTDRLGGGVEGCWVQGGEVMSLSPRNDTAGKNSGHKLSFRDVAMIGSSVSGPQTCWEEGGQGGRQAGREGGRGDQDEEGRIETVEKEYDSDERKKKKKKRISGGSGRG